MGERYDTVPQSETAFMAVPSFSTKMDFVLKPSRYSEELCL